MENSEGGDREGEIDEEREVHTQMGLL